MTSELESFIEERVVSATRRSSFTNQDYAHLKKHIVHRDHDDLGEAACALIRKHGPTSEFYWPIQEVVGRLLVDLKPPLSSTLDAALLTVLDTWNPSVEQFPMYLKEKFGIAAVRTGLSQFESRPLSPRARESVRTMVWWLSGRLGKEANQTPEPTAPSGRGSS